MNDSWAEQPIDLISIIKCDDSFFEELITILRLILFTALRSEQRDTFIMDIQSKDYISQWDLKMFCQDPMTFAQNNRRKRPTSN